MRSQFVQIPNIADETVNRMQTNIAEAFAKVDQPVSLVIKTVTANYLVSADDDVVLCDASNGGFTVSLPKLGVLTKPISIRLKASGKTVTVSAPKPTTVDGAASLTLTTAPVRLVSNPQGYWSS